MKKHQLKNQPKKEEFGEKAQSFGLNQEIHRTAADTQNIKTTKENSKIQRRRNVLSFMVLGGKRGCYS